MPDQLTTLFWRIEDDPLDVESRLEYETIVRALSPASPQARFMELDREFASVAANPVVSATSAAEMSSILLREDPLWASVMPRLYDLWLDSFTSELSLAVENGLRICCRFSQNHAAIEAPLIVVERRPAHAMNSIRDGLISFIARYKRRPENELDLIREKVHLAIRPTWT